MNKIRTSKGVSTLFLNGKYAGLTNKFSSRWNSFVRKLSWHGQLYKGVIIAVTSLNGKTISLARYIKLLELGETRMYNMDVDHSDGDPTNCVDANMVVVPHPVNMSNISKIKCAGYPVGAGAMTIKKFARNANGKIDLVKKFDASTYSSSEELEKDISDWNKKVRRPYVLSVRDKKAEMAMDTLALQAVLNMIDAGKTKELKKMIKTNSKSVRA